MFDERIDRRGSGSSKWDKMEELYGVSPDDGLAMWVADTEFRPPKPVSDTLHGMIDHGLYGYYVDQDAYPNAIAGWMKRRHAWSVDPAHIMTTNGIVNAVSLALHAFSQPGDGVVLFTPVYHAFARVTTAMGRKVIECELKDVNGHYELDFDAYGSQMDGTARIAILCSPHNPGGRVWTQAELEDVGAFCERHDLLLISDEIHHDLTFSGHHHIPTEIACPNITDRLVTMVAPSKTFNLGGLHTGNVVISDSALRSKYKAAISALAIGTNTFSMKITEAVYTHGDAWVDDLKTYIEENARIFDIGINSIPGIKSMVLESTYLSWVDFSGTGMSRKEFTERVQNSARIAANHGPTFGKGGEFFLRFNIGAPRSLVEEAVDRMQSAFADLQ
ncbi:MAG: MalY/PatB family protein [Pseudomonadota bacterium]